jgi:hypothetical protein
MANYQQPQQGENKFKPIAGQPGVEKSSEKKAGGRSADRSVESETEISDKERSSRDTTACGKGTCS